MKRRLYFEHVRNWDNSYTTIRKCQAGNGLFKLETHGSRPGWRCKFIEEDLKQWGWIRGPRLKFFPLQQLEVIRRLQNNQTSLKMAREVEGKPRDTPILSKSLSVH